MGASPLTRGKHSTPWDTRAWNGRIPAHAGKTARSCRRLTMRRAHPRSRGENSFDDFNNAILRGASPLTRGKPAPGRAAGPPAGRIPAHAGKTPSALGSPRPPPAHPRSRGENDPGSTQPERLMGASPLTRGKLWAERRWGTCRGRIPAHAGKTQWKTHIAVCVSAHPRSRGEN